MNQSNQFLFCALLFLEPFVLYLDLRAFTACQDAGCTVFCSDCLLTLHILNYITPCIYFLKSGLRVPFLFIFPRLGQLRRKLDGPWLPHL